MLNSLSLRLKPRFLRISQANRLIPSSLECQTSIIIWQCHHQSITLLTSLTLIAVLGLKVPTLLTSINHSCVHQCLPFLNSAVHNFLLTTVTALITIQELLKVSLDKTCIMVVTRILEDQCNTHVSCLVPTLLIPSSCNTTCNNTSRGTNVTGKILIQWDTSCKSSRRTQHGAKIPIKE